MFFFFAQLKISLWGINTARSESGLSKMKRGRRERIELLFGDGFLFLLLILRLNFFFLKTYQLISQVSAERRICS